MAQASAQFAGLDWVALEAAAGLAMVEALMGQVVVADQQADDAIGQAETLGLGSSTLVARAHLAHGLAAVLTTAGAPVALAALERYDACYVHQQHEFGGLRAYVEAMAILIGSDPVGAAAVVTAYRRSHVATTGALAEKLLNTAAFNSYVALEDYDLAAAELRGFSGGSGEVELLGPELLEARLLLQMGRPDEAWTKVQTSLAAVVQLHPAPALVQLVTASAVAHHIGEHDLEVALSTRAAALADRTGMSVAALQQMLTGYLPNRQNPLTEAERLVLASLEPEDTVASAAARLFVSVNTFKTHLRNAYRKLSVTSRQAALTKARAVGWI